MQQVEVNISEEAVEAFTYFSTIRRRKKERLLKQLLDYIVASKEKKDRTTGITD